jgi:hemoglobin
VSDVRFPDAGGDPACWAHVFERHDLATRTDVGLLVRTFYRAAAMDDLLGPVFAAAQVDWPQHLDTVTDFWMWQLLGVRGYEGNPLRAHEPVNRVIPFTDAHFDRWLSLFTETVDELFEGPTAELAKRRAAKMARALARLLRGESGPGDAAIEVLRPRGGGADGSMSR